MAVAVRRQTLERQPSLELVDVALVAPGDHVSKVAELRVDDPISGQERDRARLPQVGNHVLHEPNVGLVGGRGGRGAGDQSGPAAAGHQQCHDDDPPEPAVHDSSFWKAR